MIGKHGNDVRIRIWNDKIRKIITNGIESSDAKTKETSIILAHNMGSLGYMEYRDLIM